MSTKKPGAKNENKISQTRKPTSSGSTRSPIDHVLSLHGTIGNQAVQRLVKSGTLQAKLKIGQPGDIYEQEADRLAEQVMRMTAPPVQRQPDNEEEEEEEEEFLRAKQTSSSTPKVGPDFASRIEAMKGSGQPLPESTRSYFEPRFGRDFSQVRLHTDSRAAESAQTLNARAFTTGQDIVFKSGQYSPETEAGKKLLAHELTHVVQQEFDVHSPTLSQPVSVLFRAPEGSKQTDAHAGTDHSKLSPDEEKQVRQWIQSWKVNRGLILEPLRGTRLDIEFALAEGVVARRPRLARKPPLVFDPRTDPEVKALVEGPIARLYEKLVPRSFDTLTPREQHLLRRWLMSGRVGLTETLTGNRNHDLDVLARGIFNLRLPVDPKARRDPLLGFDPKITRNDPRCRALLAGPIIREHDEWDRKLQSALGKAWVRGKKGEQRNVAIRRISRLYARYGIPDWPKWYNDNIKPANFLGLRIIGGVHHKAIKALKGAEERLKRKATSKMQVLEFRGGRAFGGGYNARGWGGRLGAHSLGMAFDVQSAFNIEVRGAPGIAWATYAQGKNLMFAVKYLTGFDVYAFTGLYAQYERDIRKQKRISAGRKALISKEIRAASQASTSLEKAIARELAKVKGFDAARWEKYGIKLLKVAKTTPGSEKTFPPILKVATREPERIQKVWPRFLKSLQKTPRKLPFAMRGFFNFPADVVEVLVDPSQPAEMRFHWVPFHHFQLAGWRTVLKAEGVRFP